MVLTKTKNHCPNSTFILVKDKHASLWYNIKHGLSEKLILRGNLLGIAPDSLIQISIMVGCGRPFRVFYWSVSLLLSHMMRRRHELETLSKP